MKKQVFLILFLILSVVLVNAQVENDDVGARGSFLSTRPISEKVANNSIEKSTKKPLTNQKGNIKNTVISKNKSRLGLGYSLYLKGKNDEAVRVSSKREFHSGEAIRIVTEPNIDGYLYVFHTENDGKATMIFPDARLNRGENIVQAHVPYEVPSSDNPETSLRWLVFDEKSATEKLYLVLSRTPLASVPSSEELVRYCQNNQSSCPWQPSDALWQELKLSNNTPQVSDNDKDQGEIQSATEKRSIKQVVPLAKKSSAPTVIYMHRSIEVDKLVTSISLIHK
jgi:hypothetical protein